MSSLSYAAQEDGAHAVTGVKKGEVGVETKLHFGLDGDASEMKPRRSLNLALAQLLGDSALSPFLLTKLNDLFIV